MSSGQLAQLLPLVLIIGVFWLFILRPARKRQRDAMALQRGLEVGSRVMLTSGVYGTVLAIEDDTLQLEVATGVALTVDRHAVARVVATDTAAGGDDPTEPPARTHDEDV